MYYARLSYRSLSDALLRNRVTAIWYDECVLNTISILIGGKNIDI